MKAPPAATPDLHHLRPLLQGESGVRSWADVRSNMLRSLRQAAGLSQDKLAELLGVDPRTVRRAEAGTSLADDVVTAWIRIGLGGKR